MKYRIEINKCDSWPGSPVEFADTLAQARKERTRMARGTDLPSRAINITRNTPQRGNDMTTKYTPAIEEGLHQALTDIGAGIDKKPWHEDYDFSVQDEGSIKIINATSDKALAWLREKLPEEVDRWGLNGFVIEHRYIDEIVRGMLRDGLVMGEQT